MSSGKTGQRPARRPTPPLPKLQANSPLGAWLTRHLFKVVAALLLLLALLLAWILDAYGFQLGPQGLTRTESLPYGAILVSRLAVHRSHGDP